MIESTVKISMRDDNSIGCSYAIISKNNVNIIIILKDTECAIFDYDELHSDDFEFEYLLLKHYENDSAAYKDFLKLIGKMCKKNENSKYFRCRKSEDNRMVTGNIGSHMITADEAPIYESRYIEYKNFVFNIIDKI